MKKASAPVLLAQALPQLDKPVLVMLPGLDGTGELFITQTPQLSRYFDIHCLKIPVSNRQDWPDLARSVIQLIRGVQARRSVYLCGESFGGCLALQIAMTAPELLNRLIVINPASALRRHTWLRWTTQYARYVPEWMFRSSGAIALSFLANFERMEPSMQQRFAQTVRPIPQDCVTWRLDMLHRFEAPPERLKRVLAPTALLASGRDRIFPSDKEVALLKQHLPNAKVFALPESAHVCLLEKDVDLTLCLKALNFLPQPSSVAVQRRH